MIALLLLSIAAEVRARIAVEPARAQIGEPVVLSLVVERPSGVAVETPKLEPGVLGSWMFLEALGTRRDPAPEGVGSVVETTSWRAFALEGGAALPPLEISFTVAGQPETLVAATTAFEVPRALAEGEDSARPSKGFREPVAWTGGGLKLALSGLVFAAVLVAVCAVWFVRRRQRRVPVAAGPSAGEMLSRIAATPREDSGANREVLYSVTWIVRSAIDTHVGEVRAARTDAEWLALVAADSRVPEGARAAAKRLLERAERVKYAGESPTRFATDEALADARAIVEALEPARVAA